MVDFLDNKLGEVLKRTRLLYDSIIWFESFDTKLKTKILDWIRYDQLWKGIDEDGDIMGLYSEWTEMINPEKVAGTPFTLKDTGAFYKSLFIDVLTEFFVVDGDGIKTDEITGEKTDLFKRFGDGIVGLTDENKEKLAEELKIKYIENARKTLQID
jgi:hypothetical protein